jgi:hypothetical protein
VWVAYSDADAKYDDTSPLYMCIKVGKMFSIVPGPGDTFVRVRLKPEYWFSLSPDRLVYVVF